MRVMLHPPLRVGARALGLVASLAMGCSGEPDTDAPDSAMDPEEGNESTFGANAPGGDVEVISSGVTVPENMRRICLSQVGSIARPCEEAYIRGADVQRWTILPAWQHDTVGLGIGGVKKVAGAYWIQTDAGDLAKPSDPGAHCLDMATCSVAARLKDGDEVNMCRCDAKNDTQRWQILDAGSGAVTFKNQRTGKCLTATYGNGPGWSQYPAGYRAAQYPCDKRPGQAWYRSPYHDSSWVKNAQCSPYGRCEKSRFWESPPTVAPDLFKVDNPVCGGAGGPACSNAPTVTMKATASSPGLPTVSCTGVFNCQLPGLVSGRTYRVTLDGFDRWGKPTRPEAVTLTPWLP